MKVLLLTLSVLLTSVRCASSSFGVIRPTFLLGYQEVRCFKETFYEGSTIDLYIELEPD